MTIRHEEAAELLESESTRVLRWRQDCLRAAGIRKREAAALAACEADLHDMLDVKAAGCDVAVLCRIFL